MQNLRGGNTRIGLQQEKCPPLPDPSSVVNSRLCEAKRCHSDEDCGRDESLVCCYNGCIHSCLPKVNPPVGEFLYVGKEIKYHHISHALMDLHGREIQRHDSNILFNKLAKLQPASMSDTSV